jgi:hypothetical protein
MNEEDINAIDAQVAAKFPELTASQSNTAVGAIAIKLPTFWTLRPEVWFAQCEAQFVIRNVTAQITKFYHVVAALDNSTAAEVEALLLNPPAVNPYDQLKTNLIKAFGRTQEEKDVALLNLSGLGDKKPSALLRYITSLNSDPKTWLRALFLAQLPVEVRRVLAGSTNTSLEELADEADRIMAAGKISSVSAISTNYSESIEEIPETSVSAINLKERVQHGKTRATTRVGSSLAKAGLDDKGVCA